MPLKKSIILHQDRIILFIGFILVVSLSFALGRFSAGVGDSPIIFKEAQSSNMVANMSNVNANNNTTIQDSKILKGQFVGSKHSNKYHIPTCPFAKKIKPENQIWFKSARDAKQRGYNPASCVKKR